MLQNIPRPVGINLPVEEIISFKEDDWLESDWNRQRGFLSLLSSVMSNETPVLASMFFSVLSLIERHVVTAISTKRMLIPPFSTNTVIYLLPVVAQNCWNHLLHTSVFQWMRHVLGVHLFKLQSLRMKQLNDYSGYTSLTLALANTYHSFSTYVSEFIMF